MLRTVLIRPTELEAIRDGDTASLQAALDAATANRTVMAAFASSADGTVLATAPNGLLDVMQRLPE